MAVHGVCGFWGPLAVGLFAAGYPTGLNNVDSSLRAAHGMMVFLPLGFFAGYSPSWILKKLNLLRVPPEVELEGLDMAEFQQDFFRSSSAPEIIVLPRGDEVESRRSARGLLISWPTTTKARVPTARNRSPDGAARAQHRVARDRLPYCWAAGRSARTAGAAGPRNAEEEGMALGWDTAPHCIQHGVPASRQRLRAVRDWSDFLSSPRLDLRVGEDGVSTSYWI